MLLNLFKNSDFTTQMWVVTILEPFLVFGAVSALLGVFCALY